MSFLKTALTIIITTSTCLLPAHSAEHESDSNNKVIGKARAQIISDNPWLLKQIRRGGGFGNNYSRAIASNMYSRTNKAAIRDAKENLVITKLTDRTWVLQFPIVNVAVFETDEGLVVVDSGYAPAGPALVEALGKLSSKPVHTIIISHFHIDHALGAWALIEHAKNTPSVSQPNIITTREFLRQQQRDIDLNAYMTQRTHQAPNTAPKSWADVVKPTQTFDQELTITVGGESFVLKSARGETEDQLYVYVPNRKTLVTADYYQRFIPNAGNGRRPVRFIDDWAKALNDMATLNAAIMIPMHGPAINDPAEIKDRLSAHSNILNSIDHQVKKALNADIPEYLIADQIQKPAAVQGRDDVDELYVSIKDIAKMSLYQHTGWWDDMPSSWDPAPVSETAQVFVSMAGGIEKVVAHARNLIPKNIRLASQIIDQAWLAQPENSEVLLSAYTIYLERLKGNEPLQEALVYLDHLARLRMTLEQQGVAITDLN